MLHGLPFLTTVFLVVAAARSYVATHGSSTLPGCKIYPGDADWPSAAKWTALNSSVDGRLIDTIPIGSVCHNGPLGSYDAAACAALNTAWSKPIVHQDRYGAKKLDPSSIMSLLYTNRTCLPGHDRTSPCTIGYYPEYVINSSSVAHVQAGVNFARRYNIRLVIKNTGHDFLGKSIGRGSLSIWTHHFKSIEFIKNYAGRTKYNGSAMKVGAGVQVREAYEAASAIGKLVVGGEQPTIGLAGGYTQGGGHSPMSSVHGMSADQVLEMEVVTADGVLRRVDQKTNPQLYWAMRGGGGGVFAVVISMTIKTHPDTAVTTMPLSFHTEDLEAFWDAMKTFLGLTPSMNAAGIYSYTAIKNGIFIGQPIFAPNIAPPQLHALLQPLYTKLDTLGITYENNATQYPTFLSAWQNSFNPETTGVIIGMVSRLVPESTISHNLDEFTNTFRNAMDKLHYFIGFFMKPSHEAGGSLSDNAVNPAWRKAGLHMFAGYVFANGASEEEIRTKRDYYTNEGFQPVRDLTPGAGCYQSEAALMEPEWQQAFHGTNYPLLYYIKNKWDPTGLFYVSTGVGSEDWNSTDGKLCRVYDI